LHILASHLHQAVLEIHRTGKPVIAAVNGVAAGLGFSLALACDFRILDETATLRQAYTTTGLSIDGGGTFMLPRLAGLARALEIAAFDEPIDAKHAASAGLATRIARAGGARDDARALARELQARSLASFAASKHLLRRSTETPLEVQLEHERAGIVACARTAEGAEGISAFTSKRAPDFAGARTRTEGPKRPARWPAEELARVNACGRDSSARTAATQQRPQPGGEPHAAEDPHRECAVLSSAGICIAIRRRISSTTKMKAQRAPRLMHGRRL
jgi:hypothetical protein